MAKAYRYLFFALYTMFIRLSRKDYPEGKAVALLSIWNCLFLVGPFMMIYKQAEKTIEVSRWTLAPIVGLMAFTNILFFLSKKRFFRTYREFARIPDFNSKYLEVIVAAYLFAPIVLLIVF